MFGTLVFYSEREEPLDQFVSAVSPHDFEYLM